jgi:two-component system sensor histidine kinase YesM
VGRLFIEIKKEKFLGTLETTEESDVEFLVTDSKGRYIAGTNKQKGWELVSSKKISGTDWLMTTKVNENILEESIQKAAGMVFMVWFSVLAVSYFIYQPILKRLTQSLLAITEEIRNFKTGNEKFNSSVKSSNDEVGMIAEEYQKMESRIRKLVRRLKKQKETEINLYMAQINPHFIYNTLYALICVAEQKQETEIADKIKGVADILCLSLYSKPDTLHTVREEREYIEQYIDILRYKYGEGVKVKWDVKAETEEKLISVLLLYPLVENAIFHGLLSVEDKQITIRIEQIEDELRILVADNGIGMTQEEIYTIYNRFEQWIDKIETEDFDVEAETEHMGLFNLKMRLYFLYGERAFLKIDSTKGKGTKVQIFIKI